jgi:hypothetical protein
VTTKHVCHGLGGGCSEMVYQMCREMWGRESKGKGVGRGSVSSTGRQQLEDMQALQAHM